MLLGIADLYLNPLTSFEPVWLAQALTLGLPVLALGQPAGADLDAVRLLRSMELPELIARDSSDYVNRAGELAVNAASRTALVTRIKTALEMGPEFLDTLAAGDAFGALLETAFDDMVALGRKKFRTKREPLSHGLGGNFAEHLELGFAAQTRSDLDSAAVEARLALLTEPTHPRARLLAGQVALAQGRASRAVEYLMAAVQHADGDAGIWLTLAQALRANSQTPQAIQALETGLQLDRNNVTGLLLMAELARDAGSEEIAAETIQMLQQVAPDDPRVLALN
jgi:predicted O-linked N-acetylglucosamine transferase (SPINDLY family)